MRFLHCIIIYMKQNLLFFRLTSWFAALSKKRERELYIKCSASAGVKLCFHGHTNMKQNRLMVFSSVWIRENTRLPTAYAAACTCRISSWIYNPIYSVLSSFIYIYDFHFFLFKNQLSICVKICTYFKKKWKKHMLLRLNLRFNYYFSLDPHAFKKVWRFDDLLSSLVFFFQLLKVLLHITWREWYISNIGSSSNCIQSMEKWQCVFLKSAHAVTQKWDLCTRMFFFVRQTKKIMFTKIAGSSTKLLFKKNLIPKIFCRLNEGDTAKGRCCVWLLKHTCTYVAWYDACMH